MRPEFKATEPLEILRFRDLPQYLPIGHTVRDQLIREGLLEVVPLTPGGRAKGVTKRSIRKYQTFVMGLSETGDQDNDNE